jgi:hypothetical protein
MPGASTTDYYGHPAPTSNGSGANLAAAASGTAAGTIVPGGTIVTATPTNVNACDVAGTFTVAIASGEGSTSGTLATVYFAEAFAAVPKAIIATAYDSTTAATQSFAVAVKAVAAGLQAGFSVVIGATNSGLTAGDSVTIMYHVVP